MSDPNAGYTLLDITVENQIATIQMMRIENRLRDGRGAHRGAQIAKALTELRDNRDVRVIILTGKDDVFTIPPSTYGHHGNPGNDWDITMGCTRALETMCTIEKPVIAKVNGHAVGFGASLIMACDFVIAREDVIIADHHMACGEIVIDGQVRGSAETCMVTGDGGSVFAPLKMPFNIAKEYLLLGRPFTAKELQAIGVVNYAVPADQVDAKTQEIAERLLKRNAYALAMNKRVLNKYAMQNFNLIHDAAIGYEVLNFYMQTPQARALGQGRGEDRL